MNLTKSILYVLIKEHDRGKPEAIPKSIDNNGCDNFHFCKFELGRQSNL